MEAEPQVIELDEADLYAKLDQIEAALGADIATPFRQLLGAYITVLAIIRDKDVSIRRLRKIIFGGSSERSSKVMPESDGTADGGSEEGEGAPGADDASPPGQTEGEEPSAGPDLDSNSDDAASNGSGAAGRPRRRGGHGRIPASASTGCQRVIVTHSSMHPGDACPCCSKGKVYRHSKWSPVVRLKGQAPVGGTVYELEQLRCNLCGELYTAELPEEAGPNKYDPSVASTIATLRYGEGLHDQRSVAERRATADRAVLHRSSARRRKPAGRADAAPPGIAPAAAHERRPVAQSA
jgi:hypothetical protein